MIELRSARPEDREHILAISAQIWGGEDYVPHVLDGWLSEGGVVVAELDGQVAGFAKMTLLSPGEVWRAASGWAIVRGHFTTPVMSGASPRRLQDTKNSLNP